MFTVYLALQGLLFVLNFVAFFMAHRFLQRNNAISRPSDLENYKSFARSNMYLAVVYLACIVPSTLLSIYMTYAYGLMGLALVLAICGTQMALAKYIKKFEVRTRTLPCADQYLAEQERVTHSWQKKLLPDF
jgi:heme O synthase-like polyprenyltransferase